MKVPCILIIAGSDSGGGAGIQADIKTVTMLGGHAMTAITAITAQNTVGVDAVMSVPAKMVAAQIEAVVTDLVPGAVKIGMVGSADVANTVADATADLNVPVVFDPVMVATSGAILADQRTIGAFERLMRQSTLLTPNIAELAALTRRPVDDEQMMLQAARDMMVEYGSAVLAKGGHLEGDTVVDLLVQPDGVVTRWESTRLESPHTHGTGCTLASAIAVGLVRDLSVVAAVDQARTFVRLAIREAPGFGRGHGPMGHQAVRLDCGPGPRLNQWAVDMMDRAETRAFYERLGLTTIVDSADADYLRFEAPGGATLSAYADGAGVFFEHDDLDAAVARLVAAGVEFEEMPAVRPWGWRQAWLRDPAGNRVCLFQAGEMRRFPPWRVK